MVVESRNMLQIVSCMQEFTSFSDIKGPAADKLAKLHSIHERRLAEPHGSPYHMEDVCNRIPANLLHIDLNTAGYHHGCYQKFTKNLNRLKAVASCEEPSTSCSPHKSLSSSAKKLFPTECVFCGKLEQKVSRKREECIKFSVFKGKQGTLKEPTWRQIESQALELGLHSLHRMVQGEDLFAREANFHLSCRNDFNLKIISHR